MDGHRTWFHICLVGSGSKTLLSPSAVSSFCSLSMAKCLLSNWLQLHYDNTPYEELKMTGQFVSPPPPPPPPLKAYGFLQWIVGMRPCNHSPTNENLTFCLVKQMLRHTRRHIKAQRTGKVNTHKCWGDRARGRRSFVRLTNVGNVSWQKTHLNVEPFWQMKYFSDWFHFVKMNIHQQQSEDQEPFATLIDTNCHLISSNVGTCGLKWTPSGQPTGC